MPSIGTQLKQARQARGLSIKQAVQATRIRDYYIEALEADDFSAIPSPVQVRGFLRSYADFLKLNADELIHQQRGDGSAVSVFTSPNDAVDVAAAAPALSADKLTESPPESLRAAPQPEPVFEAEPEPTGEYEPPLDSADEPPKVPAISDLILAEIGNSLRQRRELLSLTLDEIERHTHVRKYYLGIIEAGRFDDLPSPVQARGMLSNYSSFLDMDTEATLLRFADALQARRAERQAALPATQTASRRQIGVPPLLRRLISPDLLFGGAMIMLLFTLTVWGGARIFSQENAAASIQAPSISDVLLKTPTAAPTATPTEDLALPTNVDVVEAPVEGEETPTPTETTTPEEGSTSLQLTISVLERTFVRVTVDGVVQKEARVLPGFAQTFYGSQRIEVLTGSGAALEIVFNQNNMGPMGRLGQVVNLVYTLNGVQTPTMTPSTTPTETPFYVKSLTPTRTQSPTRTETLTPTQSPTRTPSVTRTPSLTPIDNP